MLSFCPTSIANEGSKDGSLITLHNFAVECFTTKNSIKLQLTGWCRHSTGFIRQLIQAFFNYQSYLKEKPINELFPLIIIKEYTNVLQKCCIQVHSVKSGKSININLKLLSKNNNYVVVITITSCILTHIHVTRVTSL